MERKKVFYCEMAYVVGLVVLAIGTAFMERANFGMSMVVAPAYLVHLKVSEVLPFFSFGMAEYVFQALLLVLQSLLMRKVKRSYLLSFCTAFLYGLILDGVMAIMALLPLDGIVWQVFLYIAGMIVCSVGVALLFRSYFPPEAYELVVKELSEKFGASIGKTKTIHLVYTFHSAHSRHIAIGYKIQLLILLAPEIIILGNKQHISTHQLIFTI